MKGEKEEMKFKIHYNGRYEDEIIIEGDDIDEIREKASNACAMRKWEQDDCWSEEIHV
jgi:hypothetical protein